MMTNMQNMLPCLSAPGMQQNLFLLAGFLPAFAITGLLLVN